MSEIRYHLDEVIVKENVILRGWAFSNEYPNLSFKINGQIIDVVRMERADVKSAFGDMKFALLSGFEIILPKSKMIDLEITDEEGTAIKDAIDVKRIEKNEKQQFWIMLFKRISFSNIINGIKYFFKYGFSKTLNKIKHKTNEMIMEPQSLYEKTVYPIEELENQRKVVFSSEPKISIIVPLFNTPINFLEEMIDSVIQQTYKNWELCLADGSDFEHNQIEETCKSYKDSRIVYKKLAKNYGISGNTNEALAISTGDYIGLFDHDDILHPAALYEAVKAINEQKADFIYTDEVTFMSELNNVINPHFKPDFAIDNLRANNYICHFSMFSRELFSKVGGFRSEYDGSQDYDMVLRLSEQAKKIYHIPKVLYYWRAHANSVAAGVGAKPYVIEAAHNAISAHLERCGLKGCVKDTVVPSMYRVEYEIDQEPLVSIIIPNKDHIGDLYKCLHSIEEKTTYNNYEIIIVENNSDNKETFAYYDSIKNKKIKVVVYEGGFNFSAINNLGFQHTKGQYVILLNNDVEIISNNWIQEMLMYCQRDDVGAVGAKLYYPDNTIQHAGLGLGLLTLAGHYHRSFPKEHPGYMGRLIYAQDVTAVTAACLMVKRSIYEEVGGLDETFEVAFNDVDFCMKIREKGYLIVFTPFAELYHYESKSRGLDSEPEKRERFIGEVTRFQKKWKKELEQGDPYYNQNLTLDREDFGVQ